MILIDANLLLYATNADTSHHSKAKAWLSATLSGTETVGFSWNVLLAFLRLSTRSGVFSKPLPVEAALDVVGAWLDQDVSVLIQPGPKHFQILRELLVGVGSGGNLTSDAHLAAIAIEHGAVLCSLDSDFARFPRLLWRDPLA